MKTTSRFLWLIFLCLFLSACTTYRPAVLPGTLSNEEIPTVSKGDAVHVHLLSGQKVSGKVLWVRDQEIALGHRENYGGEDLVIAVATIESIEVRQQSDGKIEGAWFGWLLFAALVGSYYSLKSIGWN